MHYDENRLLPFVPFVIILTLRRECMQCYRLSRAETPETACSIMLFAGHAMQNDGGRAKHRLLLLYTNLISSPACAPSHRIYVAYICVAVGQQSALYA